MVGRDGRVRVMDLGLARSLLRSETGRWKAGLASTEGDTSVSRVTRAGAILGTPAYMSPEQLQGEDTDARSDVFGFCVTLWEALYGERPFAGETLPAKGRSP